MILTPTKKSSIIKISAIIIVIVLVLSGILAIAILHNGEEDKKAETQPEIIDDQISPYTNQAVFLELHRIRKKGIIDVMENSGSDILKKLPINNKDLLITLEGMRPGFGWDEKPVFSYIATLDDYTEEGKPTYKGWDTGYMNQIIWRNVKEELPETNIEVQIVEHVSQKKLLKTVTNKVVKDSFVVTYDFRTGRWSGDDEFNDSDGYGHYDGENFEIWFDITQTSNDGDVIPYWTEVNILKTNPMEDDTDLDPDKDNCSTVWEWKWGYDPHVWDNHTFLDPDLDGIQNVEEFFMEEWLANPFHKEIYIEVDYMDQTPKKLFNKDGYDGWEHTFYKESQQMLMDRYNEHNITLHVDDGTQEDMSQGGDILPFGRGNHAYQQDKGIIAGFYNNNFADERKGIFRYLVVAYGGGWCHPQDENHWYDCMCIPHNKNFFKNQLGYAMTERVIRIGQAIQVLHEMGHSCGFLMNHSGGVDSSIRGAENPAEYPWINYISCMNYGYFWERLFDYSDGTHGENDTDDWGLLDLTFFQRPSWEMEGLGAYDDPAEEY